MPERSDGQLGFFDISLSYNTRRRSQVQCLPPGVSSGKSSQVEKKKPWAAASSESRWLWAKQRNGLSGGNSGKAWGCLKIFKGVARPCLCPFRQGGRKVAPVS